MQPNRQATPELRAIDLGGESPIPSPKIAICRIAADDSATIAADDLIARNSTMSSELERSKRALYLAQERIAELTKAQLTLSGTVGRLTEQAATDALTGLSNRRRFTEALKEGFTAATAHGSPLSVAMIDIDSFKSYNDSFGHAAGDEVLWIVAKLLLRNSANDHIVARFGGEEFAILMPGADASLAIEVAERQRAAIVGHPWSTRPVSASFGISTLDRAIGSPIRLIEEADRALYHSKREGRNRVTHRSALNDAAADPAGSGPAKLPSEPFAEPGTESESVTRHDPAPPDLPPSMIPSHPLRAGPHEVAPRSHGSDSAWDALERYIQVLQKGDSTSDDYPEALSAIREATEAEIVFLCNERSGELLGSVGDQVPSSVWYHQLTRTLADEMPSGGIWRPSECPIEAGSSVVPAPSSVIVLPVTSPRSSWLVALRFRDQNPFLPGDLRASRVIWQLHADQHRHGRLHDKLKETLFGVVRCLSTAIDAKDPYTCGHSERVARIAVRLGEQMRMPRGEISDLYLAGLLHDLGKIGIRDAILCKEGPLTADEYLHIKEHPVTGERIIANVTRLAYLRPGIRGHHERFDGKGYPDGLSGESIPQIARILAVADACDAMMSVRRYRSALCEARIEEIFREGAGTQWDPRIVQHFLECRHELYSVIQRGLGQSVYLAVERAVLGQKSMNLSPQSLLRKGPSPLPNR